MPTSSGNPNYSLENLLWREVALKEHTYSLLEKGRHNSKQTYAEAKACAKKEATNKKKKIDSRQPEHIRGVCVCDARWRYFTQIVRCAEMEPRPIANHVSIDAPFVSRKPRPEMVSLASVAIAARPLNADMRLRERTLARPESALR